MEKKKPTKMDKGMIISAMRLGFGEDVYKQYVEKEIAYSILPEILGPMVCRYIAEVKNRDGKLTIKITSGALKSNLIMQKNVLIMKINIKIGLKFVRDIVFL